MNLLYIKKFSGAAAAVLLAASPAFAQIELHPSFAISGYLTGSARYVDQDFDDGDGGTFSDDNLSLDLDATKVLANIKTMPVSGTVSFYASGTENVSILDAFFTWDLGGGTTLTGGKFLSWHGYEAFDIPNMLQITYSNANSESIIPGYHKGLKLDYAQGASKMGVALLDSVYNSDGELDDGFGLEAYYVYSADDVTAYLGAAYDSVDAGSGYSDDKSLLLNLWLQYVTGSTTFAGEVAYKTTDSEFDGDVDSYFISGLAQFALSEKCYAVLRLAYGEDDYDSTFSSDDTFLKATAAFRQKISDNFWLVEEVSYTDFDNAGSQTFAGIQTRFTF